MRKLEPLKKEVKCKGKKKKKKNRGRPEGKEKIDSGTNAKVAPLYPVD